MIKIHNLGFPRIGAQRELKKALEAYWQGDMDATQLQQEVHRLRTQHWTWQRDAGMDFIPVGDFSLYDHVLDMSCLLGVVPERFAFSDEQVGLQDYFAMARGRQQGEQRIAACEMTKWFDTNYHYLVPELHRGQHFRLASSKLFDEVSEARQQGFNARPVLLGPLSWLWLAKVKGQAFDKLELLDRLLPVYAQILARLQQQGVDWVQIDEPILVLDLPHAWQQAFEPVYHRLQTAGLNYLLTTYFGELQDNLDLVCKLPVAGVHVDLVRGASQLAGLIDRLPSYKVLSIGIIDGRNIWRSDLDAVLNKVRATLEKYPGPVWLAPSCSLLHVPVDLQQETRLDEELKSWLAFARQKLDELAALKAALDGIGDTALFEQSRVARRNRATSTRIHSVEVQQRLGAVDDSMLHRDSDFEQRRSYQQQRLRLPLFPTTTIGSFPQTQEIRAARRAYRQGKLSHSDYEQQMKNEIALVIAKQEQLGLDVLVHGEAERNDMVEYFGELLEGFAFTENGWVQSYGSRCVKPPIIYGDVYRNQPMTVNWIRYAQSLTEQPVKGMLTGPVTIVNWSFVRDDQPRSTTMEQVALALRDEVLDLQSAGVAIIQIDEAALREGLPLRQRDWQRYLEKAVRAFRLTAAGVDDDTQIHTHMCYAEFNDIIEAIADMDADVITIETSRSDMELLDVFEDFHYPNDIGPGVYDIHSPLVPTDEQIVSLMERAIDKIPLRRLWINPDCGLKTRHWLEVEPALSCMVNSARALRARYGEVPH